MHWIIKEIIPIGDSIWPWIIQEGISSPSVNRSQLLFFQFNQLNRNSSFNDVEIRGCSEALVFFDCSIDYLSVDSVLLLFCFCISRKGKGNLMNISDGLLFTRLNSIQQSSLDQITGIFHLWTTAINPALIFNPILPSCIDYINLDSIQSYPILLIWVNSYSGN